MAWAISKNVLPIIGVTRVKHVDDAAQVLTAGKLTNNEIKTLEQVADQANVNTIAGWEQDMRKDN